MKLPEWFRDISKLRVYIVNGDKLMGMVEDALNGIGNVLNTLREINLIQDDIRAKITALITAGGATPEQLQELLAAINATQTEATAVKDEAAELAAPTTQP